MRDKFLIMLGERIRALRNAQGLTQEVLAERADLTPKYIGQIERAETNPTVKTLQRIASSLNISMEKLFSFQDSDESATKMELFISKIIGVLREKDENTIETVDEIFSDILKWIKIRESNNKKEN